ncbi:hypothetical protein HETIRDRAFT_477946 [Heterobasidion irregulare TC 32-1]|uniref:Uncharacterized protein n=1 Tax=Heterobasidion irregulare (strain TC 32-1) TaxID=747525 RepID=W4K012_HETIT|nr:uncharacterized protein HETIRDRAFT_477946 [Heterobasidion irregulare TC 32-1]ETW78675.1 hypothetical protein HETIRDRAFT_477946 [Heterobasidion irregulare TC 32-1]
MQSRIALLSFWALLAALLAINGASAREVRNEHTHLVRVRRELVERADLTVQPQCTDPSVKLNSHDCNVALLSTGTGIAGKIQFLRVAGTTTTGTSGTCSVKVDAVDGGTAIDISKGRFEQAFKALVAACGVSPGTVTAAGGSTGGNTKITISHS